MTATAKNQLQDTNNDYIYDAAGNLIHPGPTGTYVFDAENHLTSAGGMAYLYDGDGKRVGKAPANTPTQPNYLYWYGTGSQILEETDSAGNYQYLDMYFDGKLLKRMESDNWVDTFFHDALGNVRCVYGDGDPDGGCSDYYPFGGERPVSNGGVNVSFKFTGKERDAESGLDNFEKRYFGSSLGRFMSPDPFYNDSHPENPQSWNEYAYARNNPLRYVDPNGETATVSTTCTTDQQNNRTCNVTVTATIAVFAAADSNLTQDQLNQAATTIQNSINSAWSGSFTQDGVTYNVSTQVSVSVAGSQDAATQSGAQNIIGLTEGMAIPGSANSFVNPRSLFASDSSPDTGIWSTTMGGGLAAQSAHEFGHLLGLTESTNSADLMDSGLSQLMYGPNVHATQADFQRGVGVLSALQQNAGGPLPMATNPQTVHAPDTIQTKLNVLWHLLTHKY